MNNNKSSLSIVSLKETILQNKAEAILIVLGSIFYIFMMTFRLTYSPLWFDEYIEHLISGMSLTNGEMYSNIILTFQPPLYNFVMHFWLKVAENVFWFRLFNVFLGLVVGACVYLTIRRLYSYKAAFSGLMLLSCCYQYIYCVQECSEYQLMVMFISLTILFFVKTVQDGKLLDSVLFIFFAICAMYSQYGAMFMVIPFLSLFYIKTLISKDKKNILIITVLYGIAAVCAAAPLYLLYASKQLVENDIAGGTIIQFGVSEFLSLFTEPGRILGYLFNIPVNTFTEIALGAVGVILIVASIAFTYININKKNYVLSDLLIVMLTGYVLHYFLVVFHIYAMVHPGQSGGFYARYSYFYIPLAVAVLIILSIETKRLLIDNVGRNVTYANIVLAALLVIVASVLFIPSITKNWYKAYDNVFADTWVENRGWEAPTYLIGQARFGFNHYVTEVYGVAAASNVHTEEELDTDDFPEALWLWRTSWGGDGFDKIVKEADESGLNVTIFYDYGDLGQLAYITK